MDEDLDLITRTRAGDREAFDELVLKYQKPLYSLLYRMLSNPDDSADVLQKTFVKAFLGIGALEQRSSFKTWLYQIAINLAKNVYRDRARITQVPIDDVIVKKDPRTLDALIQKENRLKLRLAFAGLPEKQRMTVMLRVQESRKFEEIAEIMKCSVGTAKANYHHGVQKLKGMMGEQESGQKSGNGS
jgi:RNA polymerase sigma-70 factor (ECF subfamily)